MQAESVELLRETYDSFNSTGVEAFRELLAPEVEWLGGPGSVALTQVSRDEALARMEELRWDEWRMEPDDFVVREDRVVVPVSLIPRAPDSDRPAGRKRAHYWILRDGHASRLEVYNKRADAINAALGYFALLERLHERLRPRTYVEIGVHTGRSLARVRPGTVAIGIDPEPVVKDPAIERAARIFAETSDDFFRDHDLRAELGGRPVDLAFIDGMHLFEFALRDFANLEAYGSPQTVILVHDCYPKRREIASRDRATDQWSGDVWKLVPCLRGERPDLDVAVIDIRPAGLGLITGLDPGSPVLRDRIDQVTQRYMDFDYSWVEQEEGGRLGRVPHDWGVIEGLLPPPFGD
jgi:ketosteroid isomerase-like protein